MTRQPGTTTTILAIICPHCHDFIYAHDKSLLHEALADHIRELCQARP